MMVHVEEVTIRRVGLHPHYVSTTKEEGYDVTLRIGGRYYSSNTYYTRKQVLKELGMTSQAFNRILEKSNKP